MDNPIKKICFDYFSGVLSEQSAASISSFVSDTDDNRRQFAEWEREWSESYIPTFAQVSAFSAINARIKTRRRTRLSHYFAGASFAALVAVALFLWKPFTFGPQTVEPQICVVETGFREKTKITLPDSTQVWLNSASKISYPSNFATAERVVSLEGEAFFDVTENPDHPFVVNFGESQIKVLGTKFNVSSYSSEKLYQAALLEGSIEFSISGATVEMRPGEVLTYDVEKEEMSKTRADASKYAGWIYNKLEYQNITLDKLAQRLSSIYGVQINCKPGKYLCQPFGVMLDLGESLPNILDGLTLIMPVKWMNCIDGSILIKEKDTNF